VNDVSGASAAVKRRAGRCHATRTRSKPPRPLDQPPPTLVVAALDEHAIERERHQPQPLRARCDALVGGFDPLRVTVCEQVP
jgi:hypothetical protein